MVQNAGTGGPGRSSEVNANVLWEQRMGRQRRSVDHPAAHPPVRMRRLERQRLRVRQQLRLRLQQQLRQRL